MTGVGSRRPAALVLSVVAVVGVAVSVAVLAHHDGSPARPAAAHPAPARHAPAHRSADPHAAAIATARAVIAEAPSPPGATRLDGAPLTALDFPGQTPGAQHVEQTRFWTAPGTVEAAISYLTTHPPKTMRMSGSGSAGNSDGPTTRLLVFDRGGADSLQYGVVPYRGGVAVRADAQVLWAPLRSAADVVPSSVNSVDVLVVRQNPQRHDGSPTVRRTLRGAAARGLAGYVNRLPLPVPVGPHSCPMAFTGARLFDRLAFRGGPVGAQVRVNLSGCSTAVLAVGHRRPVQLSRTYPRAKVDIDGRILSALGLPIDYGDR